MSESSRLDKTKTNKTKQSKHLTIERVAVHSSRCLLFLLRCYAHYVSVAACCALAPEIVERKESPLGCPGRWGCCCAAVCGLGRAAGRAGERSAHVLLIEGHKAERHKPPRPTKRAVQDPRPNCSHRIDIQDHPRSDAVSRGSPPAPPAASEAQPRPPNTHTHDTKGGRCASSSGSSNHSQRAGRGRVRGPTTPPPLSVPPPPSMHRAAEEGRLLRCPRRLALSCSQRRLLRRLLSTLSPISPNRPPTLSII
jgi:hypothetical protein